MLTETSPAADIASAEGAARLSVCCMTSGRRPALLAGVLATLRGIADEIVVAADETRAEDVREAVAGLADTILCFPAAPPADRALAWAFRACSGTWIFNVDDDEVPSPRLVACLRELVRRRDITHAWVARRWLYPDFAHYIASRPWGTEFQLRLALADERFLQFSDVFHRPLVCHGPGAYVEAPLWHLDTALNPAARRRHKAASYERERPGMRVDGLAHNTGVYLPELTRDLELAPVPPADHEAIETALADLVADSGAESPPIVRGLAAAVDDAWAGPPFPESMYRARLIPDTAAVAPMTAGVQHTVDVHVTNDGETVWRWGQDARPAIRLGYRWRRQGAVVPEPKALRTVFPADVPPGATRLVPVHVVAPEEPGVYELEVDLIHDGVRWFERGFTADVLVRPRERLAVLAPPDVLPDLLGREHPSLEPVVLLRDAADRDAYGDYDAAAGLRERLLAGTDGGGRSATIVRVAWRTLRLARAARRGCDPLAALRAPGSRLVVGGANWPEGSAFGREWAVVAATALVWRLGGGRVEIPDDALPGGEGARPRVVRWALRRLRSDAGGSP